MRGRCILQSLALRNTRSREACDVKRMKDVAMPAIKELWLVDVTKNKKPPRVISNLTRQFPLNLPASRNEHFLLVDCS